MVKMDMQIVNTDLFMSGYTTEPRLYTDHTLRLNDFRFFMTGF